jgi:hypothetical protein
MFRTASKVSITSDMWVRLGTPGSEFTSVRSSSCRKRVSITGEVEGFLSPEWGDSRKRISITQRSGAIAETDFYHPKKWSGCRKRISITPGPAVAGQRSWQPSIFNLNRHFEERLLNSQDT